MWCKGTCNEVFTADRNSVIVNVHNLYSTAFTWYFQNMLMVLCWKSERERERERGQDSEKRWVFNWRLKPWMLFDFADAIWKIIPQFWGSVFEEFGSRPFLLLMFSHFWHNLWSLEYIIVREREIPNFLYYSLVKCLIRSCASQIINYIYIYIYMYNMYIY